ncbi:DUF4837 family protein [Mesonia aquimarina]|uniref:DUF4837 family protein n=1 Tax=Mesonia aquimarina TaxID=1504967 RepID=UPI000EF5C87E|nr:DUF4837 family protein [Mesonia aquimarina]
MKKLIVFLAIISVFTGCKDGKKDQIILTTSSGRLNHLSIISDNDLWQGEIGEMLRNKLAAPVEGLPQQEPLFTLSHIPTNAFEGFVRKNRTFLKIQKREKASFKIVQDTFARPQTGIYISGPTTRSIVDLIEQKSLKIITSLKNTEINEQQNRISKSLKNDKFLEEKMGVSLKFPTAYRYAKRKDDFFWIRKDIPNGSMEILVYEVPFSTIESDTNTIGDIIKMRDSIGKQYVPGPTEGTYMITEAAYAPYLFESKIDGKFAYETKGTWEVKDAFMAGPFLNYAVRDQKNNRYVVLEGFVFKPSATKRDHIFEIESILKSAKIK